MKYAKYVIYYKLEEDLFNLAFGDWNSELQRIDDTKRSNNGDREKILATVAATAIDFVNLNQYFIMAQTPDNKKLNHAHITVVPNNEMPDIHNDPHVIAMAERARAFLKKVGLPKGWDKKK